MPAFFSAVEQFEVPVITLQQLLQEAVPENSMIDMLKVDVEGEELAVLQGLDTSGWQRVQQVVVEVHDCCEAAAQIMADIALTLPPTTLSQTLADPVSDIDGHWISFVPGDLPTHCSTAAGTGGASIAGPGQPAMQLQPAVPPRPDGRVVAVARMLKELGLRVVIECCMILEGAPSSYNVYARRP
jgi:hypothetical protein